MVLKKLKKIKLYFLKLSLWFIYIFMGYQHYLGAYINHHQIKNFSRTNLCVKLKPLKVKPQIKRGFFHDYL